MPQIDDQRYSGDYANSVCPNGHLSIKNPTCRLCGQPLSELIIVTKDLRLRVKITGYKQLIKHDPRSMIARIRYEDTNELDWVSADDLIVLNTYHERVISNLFSNWVVTGK